MSAVGLMKAVNTGICCGIGIAEGRAAVRRTVVHQNDFIVAIILCQNTVQTAGKIFLGIVNRYDNT